MFLVTQIFEIIWERWNKIKKCGKNIYFRSTLHIELILNHMAAIALIIVST